MNEAGPLALALFGVLAASATFLGVRLARLAPWTDRARSAFLPEAAGIALAPFLLGLTGVLALAVSPEATPRFHVLAVAATLIAAAAITRRIQSPRPTVGTNLSPWNWPEKILAAALLGSVAGLLFNSFFLPLTQNDALEYALVGRELFAHPTLSTYPVLNPATNATGFHGPWTHPPLYPVLIYLANAIQGHAETPGMMRVLAPWALLACALLVGALGQLRSRLTGLLASHFVLSVPLLFLGADSALIDAFPVLGFALVLAVLAATSGDDRRCGVALGFALGVTLWTHSQAILIIPLALVSLLVRAEGRPRPKAILAVAAPALAIALLIAAWPYVRNWTIFGSPISDNPAVFALPELAWSDYFSVGRGIDSWPAKIQYGLCKGWFALEAYGVIFWFSVAGLFLRLRDRPPSAEPECARRPARMAAAFLIVYLGGVAASLILKVDLMIRNERYWLVLVPGAALLAAEGLTALRWRRLLPLAAAAGFAAISLALIAYRVRATGFGPGRFQVGECLRRLPPYAATEFLSRETPVDAVVLTLKPADMFYAHRRMISYLDPRLLPFYRETDPARALELLLALGVTHIHLPDYLLPPAYHGPLARIVARPEWAQLLFNQGGYQIYRLARRSAPISVPPQRDLTPGAIEWTRSSRWMIGGRKALGKLAVAEQAPLGGRTLLGTDSPLFQRDRAALAVSGAGTLEAPAANAFIAVEPQREYLLAAALDGHAFVQVQLWQFDAAGRPLRTAGGRPAPATLLGELSLGPAIDHVQFLRRFRADPSAAFVRIGLEIRGQARLQLKEVSLTGPFATDGTDHH